MRQLFPVADGCARGPTQAEFRRASVGGILRSTGGAGADQPWRNPSLAVMMARPISSTGEMKPFIGLGSWEVFDVGPDRAARRPLREVLSLLLDFRRTSARQLADVRPSRRSPRRFVDRNGGATRCFPRDQGIDHRQRGGLDQMQRSAQLLRTQIIDLMQCTIWWTDVLNWRRYAV